MRPFVHILVGCYGHHKDVPVAPGRLEVFDVADVEQVEHPVAVDDGFPLRPQRSDDPGERFQGNYFFVGYHSVFIVHGSRFGGAPKNPFRPNGVVWPQNSAPFFAISAGGLEYLNTSSTP